MPSDYLNLSTKKPVKKEKRRGEKGQKRFEKAPLAGLGFFDDAAEKKKRGGTEGKIGLPRDDARTSRVSLAPRQKKKSSEEKKKKEKRNRHARCTNKWLGATAAARQQHAHETKKKKKKRKARRKRKERVTGRLRCNQPFGSWSGSRNDTRWPRGGE